MKKGRRKKGGVGIQSNKVGSSPTWDLLYLGTIQWPWSLTPTWGLVLHSLGQTVEGFSGHFMPETVFLCRFNLLCVIHAGLLFLVLLFLLQRKTKTGKKNSSLCLFLFLLNSMQFCEK